MSATHRHRIVNLFGTLAITLFTPITTATIPSENGRIDLNLDGVEVRQAIRMITDLSGQNFIIDEDISGLVTLHIRNTPWQEAIALILASKKLRAEPHGHAIHITATPPHEDKNTADFVELTLRHLHAENAAALLEGRPWQTPVTTANCSSDFGVNTAAGNNRNNPTRPANTERPTTGARLLGPKGQLIVDTQHNRLFIKDSPNRIATLQRLLVTLDQPTRQVMLEARIVIADTTFSRDLGLRFGARRTQGDTIMILPATVTNAATISSATADILRIELDALEKNEKGRVIANPRVMTLNRSPAVITQGEQIPIQNSSTTNSTVSTSTTYKDALLCLLVTPNILEHGSMELAIEVHKDSRGRSISGQDTGAVPIDTHRLKTQVRVNDGETLILGGIFQADHSTRQSAVPLLADLPFLGRLFRSDGRTQRDRELLVFLTPHLTPRP
jgi:type IV pilus assembly protein PilQ